MIKEGEDVYDVPSIVKFDYFAWISRKPAEGGPQPDTAGEKLNLQAWAEGRIPIAGSLRIAVPQAHTTDDITDKLDSTISSQLKKELSGLSSQMTGLQRSMSGGSDSGGSNSGTSPS